MVEKAFQECDLNHEGRLTFEEFKMWVQRNPEIMEYIESILPYSSNGPLQKKSHTNKKESLPHMKRISSKASMGSRQDLNHLAGVYMYGYMDVNMDGWIYVCIYVCKHIHIYSYINTCIYLSLIFAPGSTYTFIYVYLLPHILHLHIGDIFNHSTSSSRDRRMTSIGSAPPLERAASGSSLSGKNGDVY
jgi:hypothetical protein